MRKIAREFPKSVCLETFNLCNGSCIFCPYTRVHSEEKILLEDKYVISLIDEAAKINVERFSLFNNNEPLLDERIYDFIAYARAKIPNARTTLSSNGKIISTEKMSKAIKSGIDNFYISIPTLDEEMSKKIMGFNARNVVEKIMDLPSELYKNVRIAVPLTRYFDREAYTRIFEPVGIKVITWEMEANADWLELDDIKSLVQVRCEYGCDRPLDQAIISSNGDVLLCCRDWKHEAVLGNIKEKSLADIWRGEVAKEYQKKFESGRCKEIPLCSNCSRVTCLGE